MFLSTFYWQYMRGTTIYTLDQLFLAVALLVGWQLHQVLSHHSTWGQAGLAMASSEAGNSLCFPGRLWHLLLLLLLPCLLFGRSRLQELHAGLAVGLEDCCQRGMPKGKSQHLIQG